MELKVALTLTDEMLGTLSSNVNIWEDYQSKGVASEEAKSEERKLVEESIAKSNDQAQTIFLRQGDDIVIPAYMLKANLKEASRAMIQVDGSLTHKISSAYVSKIVQLVFVQPKYLKCVLPPGATVGTCQRPLITNGPQGKRTALAKSETIPAGTKIYATITCLAEKVGKVSIQTNDWIEELLRYGALYGLGQWRNSGKGTFTFEYV